MKAISLLQPWAQLVVMGAKKYETRGWQTFHRGRILIHASKPMEQAAERAFTPPFSTFIKDYSKIPYGAIVGECRIEGCYQTEMVRDKIHLHELAFGDYSTGRWAWLLTNPVIYKVPIPYKGSLSVWDFPDELLLNHKLTNK